MHTGVCVCVCVCVCACVRACVCVCVYKAGHERVSGDKRFSSHSKRALLSCCVSICTFVLVKQVN